MTQFRAECLILLLMFLVSFTFNAYCNSRWDDFFNEPDSKSLTTLEKTIAAGVQRCGWGEPNNLEVIPAEKRRPLFELISKGNESAFRVGLLVSKCLDSGDLEDFYRSAGSFFELQPCLFLKVIKEKTIPDSDFQSLLTMFPLDTVDSIDRQMMILKKRITTMGTIDERSLNEIKKRGLFFLKREIDNLGKLKRKLGK